MKTVHSKEFKKSLYKYFLKKPYARRVKLDGKRSAFLHTVVLQGLAVPSVRVVPC